MRVIIAGSRTVSDPALVAHAIRISGWLISEVVSGQARGVDTLGELWALSQGVAIRHFPAQWSNYGKGAGHKRNAQMAEYADGLIAIWDGRSPGTRNMIQTMHKLGKPVQVRDAK